MFTEQIQCDWGEHDLQRGGGGTIAEHIFLLSGTQKTQPVLRLHAAMSAAVTTHALKPRICVIAEIEIALHRSTAIGFRAQSHRLRVWTRRLRAEFHVRRSYIRDGDG